MKEGEDIVSHISKFCSLINQLIGINEEIMENDAKSIILKNMPNNMSHKVFNLSKINPTLESIISTLLDETKKTHLRSCTCWVKIL
jgi:ribosomal protein S12 methylthiotransferase accessory factor YcaO